MERRPVEGSNPRRWLVAGSGRAFRCGYAIRSSAYTGNLLKTWRADGPGNPAAATIRFRFGATAAFSDQSPRCRRYPRRKNRATMMVPVPTSARLLLVLTAAAAAVTVNVTHLCGPHQPRPRPAATSAAVAESEPSRVNGTSPPPPPSPPSVNGASPPPPSVNGSYSARPLLFAVGREQWTGIAYAAAGRTDVRRTPSAAATASGPTALGQTRFPSAKYGENVKLDQQTSRPDFGAAAAGPFGIGFAVGDAGLRYVGVAEAAVMWHSLPADLVLDLVTNVYGWDAVAKKVFTLTVFGTYLDK